MARYAFFLGALFNGLAVCLGAFAAHALKDKLPEYHMSVFQRANQYQYWHAFALLAVGLAYKQKLLKGLDPIVFAFVFGIIVFCGSLYVLALTDIRALGMITPIGGLSFLVGWTLLTWRAWQER